MRKYESRLWHSVISAYACEQAPETESRVLGNSNIIKLCLIRFTFPCFWFTNIEIDFFFLFTIAQRKRGLKFDAHGLTLILALQLVPLCNSLIFSMFFFEQAVIVTVAGSDQFCCEHCIKTCICLWSPPSSSRSSSPVDSGITSSRPLTSNFICVEEQTISLNNLCYL